MSSREIAELTGKRHDNVIRDIKAMLTDLSFEASDFAGSYIDPTGRELPCFNLPKRETTILVSGYSVTLRARIVDRWMELEEQARSTPITTPALPDFSNPAEAARAWAEQYEHRPSR
ncbi:Rha family transcriptional regulator [Sinorhizobium sp. BG8]|nr:Rha family transcriptional regulator [Sinorhizobium sp. BG8]